MSHIFAPFGAAGKWLHGGPAKSHGGESTAASATTATMLSATAAAGGWLRSRPFTHQIYLPDTRSNAWPCGVTKFNTCAFAASNYGHSMRRVPCKAALPRRNFVTWQDWCSAAGRSQGPPGRCRSRSATSLAAHGLYRLGARLPDRGNPDGHCEPRALVAVNDAILSHIGLAWDAARTIPDGWFDWPMLLSHPGRGRAALSPGVPSATWRRTSLTHRRNVAAAPYAPRRRRCSVQATPDDSPIQPRRRLTEAGDVSHARNVLGWRIGWT